MKKLSVLAILLMTVSLNVFSANCGSVSDSTDNLSCSSGTSLYVISENGQNKTVCLNADEAASRGATPK